MPKAVASPRSEGLTPKAKPPASKYSFGLSHIPGASSGVAPASLGGPSIKGSRVSKFGPNVEVNERVRGVTANPPASPNASGSVPHSHGFPPSPDLSTPISTSPLPMVPSRRICDAWAQTASDAQTQTSPRDTPDHLLDMQQPLTPSSAEESPSPPAGGMAPLGTMYLHSRTTPPPGARRSTSVQPATPSTPGLVARGAKPPMMVAAATSVGRGGKQLLSAETGCVPERTPIAHGACCSSNNDDGCTPPGMASAATSPPPLRDLAPLGTFARSAWGTEAAQQLQSPQPMSTQPLPTMAHQAPQPSEPATPPQHRRAHSCDTSALFGPAREGNLEERLPSSSEQKRQLDLIAASIQQRSYALPLSPLPMGVPPASPVPSSPTPQASPGLSVATTTTDLAQAASGPFSLQRRPISVAASSSAELPTMSASMLPQLPPPGHPGAPSPATLLLSTAQATRPSSLSPFFFGAPTPAAYPAPTPVAGRVHPHPFASSPVPLISMPQIRTMATDALCSVGVGSSPAMMMGLPPGMQPLDQLGLIALKRDELLARGDAVLVQEHDAIIARALAELRILYERSAPATNRLTVFLMISLLLWLLCHLPAPTFHPSVARASPRTPKALSSVPPLALGPEGDLFKARQDSLPSPDQTKACAYSPSPHSAFTPRGRNPLNTSASSTPSTATPGPLASPRLSARSGGQHTPHTAHASALSASSTPMMEPADLVVEPVGVGSLVPPAVMSLLLRQVSPRPQPAPSALVDGAPEGGPGGEDAAAAVVVESAEEGKAKDTTPAAPDDSPV
ncbi:hypothetical protein PAPYR_963 [Paratrimastix pyriformis]|uniref:Uncharacterized protein n=1 Tax=Paratrimastix pyriformis TaxID=342808 RepID=A0ABQ8UVD5_9EUKA|nr:hypothetical protein PAPYR_963 [Paratrimastix pyriformis]